MTTKIYANSIAKYNEGRLLDSEKLRRISDADFSAAVRMLADYGYGGGRIEEKSFDPERFITAETNALIAFILDDAPSDSIAGALTARFSYNNAKVFYKGKFVSVDYGAAVYSLAPELRKHIETGDYASLPSFMAEALEDLDQEKAPNPKTIDAALTKAMYKDALNNAVKSKSAVLVKFITSEIDLTNILTALRARSHNFAEEKFAPMLIEGGAVSPEIYSEALVCTDGAKLIRMFEDTPYAENVEKAVSGSLALFEASSDDFLFLLTAKDSENMLKIDPFLHYFTAKSAELKAVKTILTLIKNDAREEIAPRLRMLGL